MQSLMSDDNPYAPPKAVDLILLDDHLACVELADRSIRFTAWFMDQVLVTIVVFTILLGNWGWLTFHRGENFLLWVGVGVTVFYFLIFLLIHGYSLKKNGQTIGHKMTNIRLSDLQGNVPSFTKLILLRYLTLLLVSPMT